MVETRLCCPAMNATAHHAQTQLPHEYIETPPGCAEYLCPCCGSSAQVLPVDYTLAERCMAQERFGISDVAPEVFANEGSQN